MPAKKRFSERWWKRRETERKAHKFIDPVVSEIVFERTHAAIVTSINTAIASRFEQAIRTGSFKAKTFQKGGYVKRIANDALSVFKLYLHGIKPKYYETLSKVVREKIMGERKFFDTHREQLIDGLMKRTNVDRETAEQLFVANVAAFNYAYDKILKEIERRRQSGLNKL